MSVSLPVDGPGDAELISAVRGGDVDAYGDLFARHVDSARRLARQLAGPADADDLVSDAFTKVLTVLQRGGGPDLAFRAYLLTAVRRLHVDKIRAGSRLRPVDDLTPFDPGLPFHDTAVEGFENAAAAKAFASLPERWQMVLWHTEVEQQKPADVAPLLGMSANSVSALAYRAREGLRQAFLSQHATDPDDVDCAWTRDHLGAYVRGGLSRRDAARVDDHLASCRSCAAVYLELTEVNSGLAGILAPLLLGSAGAGYVSSGGGAGSGLLSNGVTAAKSWAAAHASLTAIGGILVTATAVASIYGATHLHSRDAADVGSPSVLHSGSVTSTVGPNGDHHHGQHGRHHGPGRTGSKGPSSATDLPTATDSPPPVAPTTLPTDATTGPGDPTSGATDSSPTGPTDSPTSPTTSPTGPTGGDQVQFTSTPPADPAFGSTYRLRASSDSGKQVTFSIGADTTRHACSLDDAGTTVTFDHAGTCVIEADVAAKRAAGQRLRTVLRSATSAEQQVVVPQEDQRIHFALPSTAQVGDELPLDATSSSGLPVTYTTNAACAVNGAATRVTMLHAVGCTVTAHQAGDGDYTEASDAAQSVQVGKGTPVITFATQPPGHAAVDGQDYPVAATSSTGDPVSLTVDNATSPNNACELTGNDDVVFHHAGTCTLTATDPGNADYQPATAQQQFQVAKGTATVSFTSQAPAHALVDGATYTPTATSTSGDNLTLDTDASSPNGACTLKGGTVTFHHAGTCTVTATDPGNADYQPATAQQTFQVAKGTQTISFTSSAPNNAVVGGATYTPSATSTSGDNLTLDTDASSPNGACTLKGGTVTFHHAGTCTVTATDPGNADYQPATAQQTFDIAKGTQTISFTSSAPNNAVVGGTPYVVTATSTSGDNLTLDTDASSPNGACTLKGGTVTFHHAGTCTVTATDPGNADYQPATAQQTFHVAKGAATVTFTSQAPAHALVDGATYTPTATSTSGDNLTLDTDASSPNGACTLKGGTVTFHHAGTCTVTATDPGNADYQSATAQQTFDIAKGAATVTFTTQPPAHAAVDGQHYAVAATSSSGDPVTLTVDNATSPNNACELTGNDDVVFHHAGTCSLTATDPGNADYQPSTAQQQFQVAKGTQTISFTSSAPNNAVVGGTPYIVTATSTSGDNLTLDTDASSPNGACTLTGNTVSFHHAGTCTVTATDPGNADYQPATAQQQFQVAKGAATVSFTTQAPAHALVDGATYTPTATSTSGDNLTLDTDASSPNGACTLKGGTVTFHHAGTCTVTATDPGNADYQPATAQQTFQVAKGTQTISFTSSAPNNAVVGGTPYVVTATSTSGDNLTLDTDASSPNGACTLKGGTVSFHHAGTCTVTATDPGNADYQPATAQQTFDIAKGAATVTFTTQAPAHALVDGATYTPTATSTSGDNLTLDTDASSPNGACTLKGGTVTFHHAGTCTLTATDPGNADYQPATAQQTFQVAKGAQVIAFTSQPPSAPTFGSTYQVSATGGASGNKVTFSLDAATTHNACSVAGSTVTFNHAGTCIVDADQAAGADYEPAPRVQQSVGVPKAAQQITFTSTPPASPRVGDKYAVSATGGASGKPVTFSSTTPKVCSVTGSTVSFVAQGGCSIAADQASTDDYSAAPTASQQVTIGGRDLTLSVTTHHGWLFNEFGTVVDVQVTGLDPGAHATLSMTSTHAITWSPSACSAGRSQVTCAVDTTPTTFSFLALGLTNDATLGFTVSSTDSQDTDPGDNTVTVKVGN